MDKLRTLCESALVAGVLVNRENIFKLARLALEYSCFSKPADNLLGKCAKFLKREISRDFGILKRFGREDYDIFQVKFQNLTLIFESSVRFLWTSQTIRRSPPGRMLRRSRPGVRAGCSLSVMRRGGDR